MRVIGRMVCVCVLGAGLVAASGCSDPQSMDDVLRGLQNAAKSKKTFDALSNTDDLAKSEKAVVNAFCSVTTQLADNQETLSEQQYFNALSNEVRAELGPLSSPAQTALAKLRATYDLASINPQVAIRYARACYR